MLVGHLKPTTQDIGPQNRRELRRVWYVVDDSGADMIGVWTISKVNAQRLAAEAGITLTPRGVTAARIMVMCRMREHFGLYWRAGIRRVWKGQAWRLGHLQHLLPDVMALKEVRPDYWLDFFKLPEVPDEKTPT